MVIGIDINDVLRDYTHQFLTLYKNGVDRTIDIQEDEIYTNEYELVLPFPTHNEYLDFVYGRYAYELYGACPIVDRKRLPEVLNNWLLATIPNIDSNEPIEVMVVSSMEYGISIPSTLFFLSKLGTKVRNFYFPSDSQTIWDKCDILVTANPSLLETKPDKKVTIKIEKSYNKECSADYTYATSTEFFKDEEKIEKIIDTYGKE